MGKLYIETAAENGRTVVRDSYFTAPFKITEPFASSFTFQGERMQEVMIMQASAGILSGDSHEMEFVIRSGSRVVITGQSYTKLFRMEKGRAEQKVRIRVENGGCLYYLPCPAIPFGGSDFTNQNEICLEEGAHFVMQDVLACGRKARGEEFAFRRYHSRTIVYEEDRPVFADNTRLIPAEADLRGLGYFEGYSHQGMAYFYGVEPVRCGQSEADRPDTLLQGMSRGRKGQVLRLLGNSSEEIEEAVRRKLEEREYGISCNYGNQTIRKPGAEDRAGSG